MGLGMKKYVLHEEEAAHYRHFADYVVFQK